MRGSVVTGAICGGASTTSGTSIASTAPAGPDPFSARRSIPRSAASRRAFGDAAMVVPGVSAT